jgi:hypothetical protein
MKKVAAENDVLAKTKNRLSAIFKHTDTQIRTAVPAALMAAIRADLLKLLEPGAEKQALELLRRLKPDERERIPSLLVAHKDKIAWDRLRLLFLAKRVDALLAQRESSLIQVSRPIIESINAELLKLSLEQRRQLLRMISSEKVERFPLIILTYDEGRRWASLVAEIRPTNNRPSSAPLAKTAPITAAAALTGPLPVAEAIVPLSPAISTNRTVNAQPPIPNPVLPATPITPVLAPNQPTSPTITPPAPMQTAAAVVILDPAPMQTPAVVVIPDPAPMQTAAGAVAAVHAVAVEPIPLPAPINTAPATPDVTPPVVQRSLTPLSPSPNNAEGNPQPLILAMPVPLPAVRQPVIQTLEQQRLEEERRLVQELATQVTQQLTADWQAAAARRVQETARMERDRQAELVRQNTARVELERQRAEALAAQRALEHAEATLKQVADVHNATHAQALAKAQAAAAAAAAQTAAKMASTTQPSTPSPSKPLLTAQQLAQQIEAAKRAETLAVGREYGLYYP